MTGGSLSVAMTAELNTALRSHLLRPDGDEDICLATYSVSTGARRVTHLIDDVLLPGREDRIVHGNATIRGEYVLREATAAAAAGRGLAILHSHPRGRGWQQLSRYDHDAERSYATLVREVTGLPLIGLTLAGVTLLTAEAARRARARRTAGPTAPVIDGVHPPNGPELDARPAEEANASEQPPRLESEIPEFSPMSQRW